MEPGTLYTPRTEEERAFLEELAAHTSTPEFAAYLASGQYERDQLVDYAASLGITNASSLPTSELESLVERVHRARAEREAIDELCDFG